jgi:hypothetical protein
LNCDGLRLRERCAIARGDRAELEDPPDRLFHALGQQAITFGNESSWEERV